MTMGAHQGDYFPGAPFCFLDYDYRFIARLGVDAWRRGAY